MIWLLHDPGRKRGAGEVGRMTRSVRQHLDAPLELLSEYPVRVVRVCYTHLHGIEEGKYPLTCTMVF